LLNAVAVRPGDPAAGGGHVRPPPDERGAGEAELPPPAL